MTDQFPWETDSHTLHDYQRKSVRVMEELSRTHKRPRLCLYYKTGSGKTITAIACMRAAGQRQVLVVAPPVTRDHWIQTGAALGVTVDVMSHAKFRQKETKLSRTEALIVDEFHLLGGYKAVGFKKLERLSLTLDAPLVIASATPNYNDVERCYCIQRVTDARATEGGYLSFIYRHCGTEVNPFGHVPKVTGFLKYPDAASFLADMKNVEYIEDDLVYDIEDWAVDLDVPNDLMVYGVDRRNQRMIGSQIERKHREIIHMLVTENGELAPSVLEGLLQIIEDSPTPVLVFATHTEVVQATVRSLLDCGVTSVGVTGKTSYPQKTAAIDAFKSLEVVVLVGTVTLATGTDGLDKMCDTMVILDDTEDNAMRRQLIGRIMPRGHAAATAHTNHVVRVVATPTAGP